jgi:hypothetical protein
MKIPMRPLRIAPAVIVLLVVLAACTSTTPKVSTQSSKPPIAPTTPMPHPSPSPLRTIGGCGATKIQQGGTVPAWTASAMSGFTGDPGPYVVSAEANVVGILMGYPFHAGTSSNPTSKILWIVREPRNGQQLKVDGHPVGATTPTGHADAADDSSPGEIYPSIVDMPTPGCWHLTLTWDGNTATVDLPYGPPK